MEASVVISFVLPLKESSKAELRQVLNQVSGEMPFIELNLDESSSEYRSIRVKDFAKAVHIAEALRKIPGVIASFPKPDDELP